MCAAGSLLRAGGEALGGLHALLVPDEASPPLNVITVKTEALSTIPYSV